MWCLTPSTASPAQEADSWQTSCLDIELLAQSKSSHIPEKFCLQGSLTDAYLHSLSGTMLQPSESITPIREATLSGYEKGVRNSPFVAGSRSLVKTLVVPEKEKALLGGNKADSGPKWQGSFARWDQDLYSWKTPQCSLLGDSELFLETWPRWGLMLDGECWERPISVEITTGKEYGYWATPTATDWKGSPKLETVERRKSEHMSGVRLPEHIARHLGIDITTKLNPAWSEVLMTWPIGWTDLKPLEMDRCHCVQPLHGDCLQTFDCWERYYKRQLETT